MDVLKVYFRQIGNKIQLCGFHDPEVEKRFRETIQFDMANVYRAIEEHPEKLRPITHRPSGIEKVESDGL